MKVTFTVPCSMDVGTLRVLHSSWHNQLVPKQELVILDLFFLNEGVYRLFLAQPLLL